MNRVTYVTTLTALVKRVNSDRSLSNDISVFRGEIVLETIKPMIIKITINMMNLVRISVLKDFVRKL